MRNKVRGVLIHLVFLIIITSCIVKLPQATTTPGITSIPTIHSTTTQLDLTQESPPVTEVVIPTPTTRVMDGKKTGLECVGAAINAGHPPVDLKDLIIQINVPGQKTDEFITYFQSFAGPCDGIGIQGRFPPTNWEKIQRINPRNRFL